MLRGRSFFGAVTYPLLGCIHLSDAARQQTGGQGESFLESHDPVHEPAQRDLPPGQLVDLPSACSLDGQTEYLATALDKARQQETFTTARKQSTEEWSQVFAAGNGRPGLRTHFFRRKVTLPRSESSFSLKKPGHLPQLVCLLQKEKNGDAKIFSSRTYRGWNAKGAEEFVGSKNKKRVTFKRATDTSDQETLEVSPTQSWADVREQLANTFRSSERYQGSKLHFCLNSAVSFSSATQQLRCDLTKELVGIVGKNPADTVIWQWGERGEEFPPASAAAALLEQLEPRDIQVRLGQTGTNNIDMLEGNQNRWFLDIYRPSGWGGVMQRNFGAWPLRIWMTDNSVPLENIELIEMSQELYY